MTMTNVIAIDGPSGSGKSTVAKIIARELNLQYIDTGAMYRAITYKIFKNNVDISKGNQLLPLLDNTKFEFKNFKLCMDGYIVGDEIRSPQIDAMVSAVSANKHVRDSLANKQIEMGKATPSVLDGRDIGTVLFPDAIVKIFLIADARARAKRRHTQNARRGIHHLSIDEIEAEIKKRDYVDSNRTISPLAKAQDSVEIDTSNITVDETVRKIISLYKERLAGYHV